MQRRALIQARQALGLTRPQLADKLGMDRTVLYKVEVGIQDTGVEYMRRWVAALGPGATLDLFLPPKNALPRIDQRGRRARMLRRARLARLARAAQPEPAA